MRNLLLALLLVITIPSLVQAKPSSIKIKKAVSVTKAQALKMVAARPEVKRFIARVSAAGKSRGVTANIEYDRLEGGEHVIQVFELVPDGDDSAHTATFNWYHVNAKTGKISKEF